MRRGGGETKLCIKEGGKKNKSMVGTEKKKKRPRRDSNPQSSDPKSDALSIRPRGRVRKGEVQHYYLKFRIVSLTIGCIVNFWRLVLYCCNSRWLKN